MDDICIAVPRPATVIELDSGFCTITIKTTIKSSEQTGQNLSFVPRQGFIVRRSQTIQNTRFCLFCE